MGNKKIIEGVVVNNPSKTPKMVEVWKVWTIVGTILVLGLVFFAGWKANDMHETQYNTERASAIQAYIAQSK